MSDAKKLTCTSCGHTWLGTTSTCPQCKGFGKSDSDDTFTKKVVDDDDLRKGL